jgi:hypothetical protein
MRPLPPPSGFTYASEVAARRRRRILRQSIMLLVLAGIGAAILAVFLIAITPGRVQP